MKITINSLLFAGAIMSISLLSQAESIPESIPYIATSATGVVEAVPDMATLEITIETADKTALQAKKTADEKMAHYFTFLQQQGIAKKDIDAANIRTQAQYQYPKDKAPQLTGYQAIRHIKVIVRQLDKLNPLLDGALAAGLNEIQSVEMGVSDAKHYQQQARSKAIENAIAQAKAVAAGFSAQLGPVYRIQYHANDGGIRPMNKMYSMAEAASRDNINATYQQPTLRFDDQVEVVFQLKANN